MLSFVLLITLLLAGQTLCALLARRDRRHLMRPGTEWTPEDLDHWLALIETFPLGEKTTRTGRPRA